MPIKPKKLTKEEASRIEQRTLTLSLYGVVALAFGSLVYGFYIQSSIVILNGILSMVSLMGSWLNLLAAKLVTKPADKRFQYGYWHVEPMVLSVNTLMMSIICIYAIFSGVEGLRSGGDTVDATAVIWFAVVTGALCGAFGLYERFMSYRIDSQILMNDSREWLMDFGFSLVTFLGFIGMFFLPEPYLSFWAKYADNGMVVIMSSILLPFPMMSFAQNIKEVLRITDTKEELISRVENTMQALKKNYHLLDYSSHILKVGRTYFVEINILANEQFEFQTIADHDKLRELIWKACDKPLDELWLSVCVTADPRWT